MIAQNTQALAPASPPIRHYPALREPTYRQSLYIMTVLVPVVATLGVAVGELARRAIALAQSTDISAASQSVKKAVHSNRAVPGFAPAWSPVRIQTRHDSAPESLDRVPAAAPYYSEALTPVAAMHAPADHRAAEVKPDRRPQDADTPSLVQISLSTPTEPSWMAARSRLLSIAPSNSPTPALSPPQGIDPVAQNRMFGFAALRQNQPEQAAAFFLNVIAINPSDAEAIGGLGLVRLRQRQMDEGSKLLRQAIALAPALRESLQPALDGARAGGGGRQANPAQAMIDQGDLSGAERELTRQLVRGGNAALLAPLLLADVWARQGRLDEAEAAYRKIRFGASGNVAALVGLSVVMDRTGRNQEAAALLNQANLSDRNLHLVGQARAQMLRDQARASTNLTVQMELYRAATIADPVNPWLQLELARTLVRLDRLTEARTVMTKVVAGAVGIEALHAGVLFAAETNDAEAVSGLIARLPASGRTSDILALQQTARLWRDIAAALGQPRIKARHQLMALAATMTDDPTGARGTALARALHQLGDRADALQVLQIAQVAMRGLTPTAKQAYANTLVDLGYTAEAATLLARSSAKSSQSESSSAIVTHDASTHPARQSETFDRLAPALTTPVAVTEGGGPRKALVVNEAMLRRDPRNMSARRGAINAALQLGDHSLALRFVQEGLKRAPNDPDAWLAAAAVDRARGLEGRVVQNLERARGLRQQQLGYANPDMKHSVEQRAKELAKAARDATAQPDPPVIFLLYQQTSPADDAPAPRRPEPPPLKHRQDVATLSREIEPFGRSEPFTPQPVSPPATTPVLINPFRRTVGAAVQTTDATVAINPRSPDPVLASIDREMAELRDLTAPTGQAGFEFRTRSGDAGLSRLNQYAIPMQATFSPYGVGRVKLEMTPTILNAGRLDGSSVTNYARFGSAGLALQGAGSSVSYVSAAPDSQQATGLALNLGYELNGFKTDIGSTPLGFRTTNVLGGIEWAPQISDRVRLRLIGERRAVTDTLLSYAGTSDPRTGQIWGGVTRTGARAQLEASVDKLDMYVAAGGAILQGTNVQNNTMFNVQAGAFVPIWRTADQELRVGLNLTYFQYAKNLEFFTLGHGGYFSPQSYMSAIIPINYRGKINEDFSYEANVGLGVQTYRTSAADYYPSDPALQAAWATTTAGIPGLSATYSATSRTGLAGNARMSLDYNITPNLRLSARLAYQQVGDYREASSLIFAKYTFNGADQ